MAHRKIIGMRFGQLVVQQRIEPYITPKGKPYAQVRCACDCGNMRDVALQSLTSGQATSCGCLKALKISKAKRTHGGSKEKLYSAYNQMVSRCRNPDNKLYRLYGARGISVAPEWLGSGGYEAFREYVGPRPSMDYSIDRIDVNGNYEPGNVRWADRTVQARNRRDCIFVEIDGERVHFVEAAERLGVNIATARTRRQIYKMTPEEALGLVPHPLHRSPKRKRAA